MESKWLRYGLIGLGGLLVLCIIFGAGFFIGRANLRNAAAPSLFERGLLFGGAHGAAGSIQAIQGQTFTLKLRDGSMQTILITKDTRIERGNSKATASDLKIDDRVLIVGTPNAQGQIQARLIRVVDLRPATPTPRGRIEHWKLL